MRFLPVATAVLNDEGTAYMDLVYVVSSLEQAHQALWLPNVKAVICVDVPRSQVVRSMSEAIRFFKEKP